MGIQGEGEEGGAKLTNVTAGGPADKAGMRDGDIIVELDAKAVTSYPDLTSKIQLHKAGETVRAKIQRDNVTSEVDVTFVARPAGGAGAGGAGGRTGATAGPYSSGLGGQRENSQERQGDDGFQTGGVYRSADAGETWTRVNSLNPRPFYFSRIQVDPSDDNNVYVLGISSYKSSDGGKTFSSDLARGVHSDHHALWIDPRDGRHLLLGGDGGLYSTHDRGATWEHVNIMPLGQFYHVAVDSRRPYRVYGGLQDNGSWGGPNMTRGRGPTNEDWVTVGGGDGFTCQVDQNDSDLVYYTSQYGNMGRINVRTGERRSIRPQAEQGLRLRFNWKTPFVLSNHNSKIFYAAGNYVFKSLDRGDKLRTISPQITATERGTASSLAESPLNPDLLYVGTDDGALWMTRTGGHEWINITATIQEMPGKACFASIEPSRFKEGRCYVAIDAHRVDSTAPFLFVTDDYGSTWSSLRANLPDGSARTIREDIQNENLLYLGTEFGAWTSIDRGYSWIRLNNNLPTVAVHDFAQPRTANELVAATHGRSIWILDVTPLRQFTKELATAPAHLFRPAPAVTWGNGVGRSLYGHKRYTGENPADGASIHYLLSNSASEVKLSVVDADGKFVRELPAKKEAGLHRAVWDLRRVAQRSADGPPAGSRQGTQGARSDAASQGGAGGTRLSRVLPGQYRIVLTIDGRELSQPVVVEADPQFAMSMIAEDEDDDEDW
jgi:PDZ domain